MRIEIKAEKVLQDLNRLSEAVSDLREPLDEAGLYLERETRLNFARQSDPDGKPWAGLKASTLRQKKIRAILRESSTLVGGIEKEPASSSSVRVKSTGTDYGIYHATGTKFMPARPFIGIGARHKAPIERIFESYLGSL